MRGGKKKEKEGGALPSISKRRFLVFTWPKEGRSKG